MENIKITMLEIRLEILLFILDKLESLKKSLGDDHFLQFRNLLMEEKIMVENKLIK